MNNQTADLLKAQKSIIEPLAHCKCLNITVIAASKGKLILKLPYSTRLIGNPDSGVLHGGAITALMDTACGFAGMSALDEFSITPTIDLKIDYLNPAKPKKTILAEAKAYCVKRSIIFTEAIAYHENEPDYAIARCSANFVRLLS